MAAALDLKPLGKAYRLPLVLAQLNLVQFQKLFGIGIGKEALALARKLQAGPCARKLWHWHGIGLAGLAWLAWHWHGINIGWQAWLT